MTRPTTLLLAALLITLLALATSGCGIITFTPAGASSANKKADVALEATVFEPELRYHRGRLYTTIVLNRAPRDSEQVEAKLVGPGAPDAPIQLEGSCHSLAWRQGAGYNTKVLRDDEACSFELPHADAEAAEYRVVVSHGGATIGERAFSLVEVAGMGGKALVVDPDLRTGKAYVRDLTWMLWLPIDASYEWRQLIVFFLQDGELKNLERPFTINMHPHRLLEDGDPAVDLVRLQLSARPSNLGSKEGRWQAVVFAGSKRIGAWSWETKWVATGKDSRQLRGLGDKNVGPYSLLATGSPGRALDDAMQAAVAELLPRKVRSYGKLRDVPRYRKRLEPRVCAVLSQPKTAELAQQLEELRKEGTAGTSGDTYTHVGSISVSGGGSIGVSAKTGSGTIIEGPPRWDTGKPPGGIANSIETKRNRDVDKKFAAKLRQLDAQTGRFKPGCMDALIGELDWQLPPPGADEPAY